MTESLPYRPNVGIMLANQDGLVFVGQRLDSIDTAAWQMPQGGIDSGETEEDAAFRELTEETGIAREHVTLIARAKEEYIYDLPDELIGKLWKGKWRGQRQTWFLMRFIGEGSDINIATKDAEFSTWKWVKPEELPGLIVPFKKRIYEGLVREFGNLV
jgi:putative (di)nucleoside polyphosphate hydrolase